MFSPSAAPSAFSINGTSIEGVVLGDEDAPPQENTAIVAIVIMIFVVCFLFAGPSAYMRATPVRTRSSSSDTTTTARKKKQVSDPQKVKRRYQTISNWLITKDVIEHANHRCAGGGDNVQHSNCETSADTDDTSLKEDHHTDTGGEDIDEDSATNTNSTALPEDDAADAAVYDHDFSDYQHRNDCHICMEEFQVGDKVSWSASDSCNHAYHFQCIKEWLLKKKDCPYCRQTMLPVDDTFTDIAQLAEAKTRKEELTFFCQKDGLIVMPSSTTRTVSPPTSIRATDVPAVDEEFGDGSFVAGIVVDDDDIDGQFDIEPPLGNDAIVEAVIGDGVSTDDEDLEAGQVSRNDNTV
jgi:hypothetical protein